MTGQVLVSTRSQVPAVAQPSGIEQQFRMAQAIAKAGALLPPQYNGNPGAVLLITQWATTRGIDVMTAMHNVAFVKGKPVVDATMQRALAERAGYEPRVVAADRTSATVEVWRGDRKIGSATYTQDDATVAGLALKENWQRNPEDMLVARATTRALKRHAPSVMLGVLAEDELDHVDPVQVLEPPAEVVADPVAPEPVEAVVVDETDPDEIGRAHV